MATKLSGRPLVLAMCIGQVGNLLPHMVVPGVMASHLMSLWSLDGAKAGLLLSSYTFGYMLAVPILVSLTDRMDARYILLAGSAASALFTISFGLFADGLWSATALWGLAGVGFAGAYMPGLKVLTDRLSSGDSSRSITLYTSSFSLGVGLSFLVSQVAADYIGWRAAFLIVGAGPAAMIATCLFLPHHQPPPGPRRFLDVRAVIKNRASLGYIFAYGCHCFELNGLRGWLVPFWTFVAAKNGGGFLVHPVIVSVLVTSLSMPASLLGNEAALRYGRSWTITAIMIISAGVALTIAFASSASPYLLLPILLLYAVTVSADSGALTAGMMASTPVPDRGITMAFYTTAGSCLSAIGTTVVGVGLDAGGGPTNSLGWTIAFAILAVAILLGPLGLRRPKFLPLAAGEQPSK